MSDDVDGQHISHGEIPTQPPEIAMSANQCSKILVTATVSEVSGNSFLNAHIRFGYHMYLLNQVLKQLTWTKFKFLTVNQKHTYMLICCILFCHSQCWKRLLHFHSYS